MSRKTVFKQGLVFGAFCAVVSLMYVAVNPHAYYYLLAAVLGIIQIIASTKLTYKKKKILSIVYFLDLLYCIAVIVAVFVVSDDFFATIVFILPIVVIVIPLIMYLLLALRKIETDFS